MLACVLCAAACGPGVDTTSAASADGSDGTSTTGPSSTTTGSTGDPTPDTDTTGEPQAWCLATRPWPALSNAELVLGDADGDGRDELWVTRFSEVDVQVQLSSVVDNGGDTLEVVAQAVVDGNDVTLVDVDADGRDDLVVYEPGDPLTRSWMPSGGDGTFGAKQPISLAPGVWGTWRDFTGDGRADLLERQPSPLTLYVGDGAGNFTAAGGLPFETDGRMVADMPAPGMPGHFMVLAERTCIGFCSDVNHLYAIQADIAGAIVANTVSDPVDMDLIDVRDYDGDGRIDAVAIEGAFDEPKVLVMLRANAAGGFDRQELDGNDHIVAGAGDLDGDGLSDLLFGTDDNLSVRFGTSTGFADRAEVMGFAEGAFGIAPKTWVDLDANDRMELIINRPVAGETGHRAALTVELCD